MSTSAKKPKPTSTSTDKARKAAIAEIGVPPAGMSKEASSAPKALVGKPAKAKTPKGAKASKAEKPRKIGCLTAAAQVLGGSKAPMRCTDMIAAMEKQGLWRSPGGKTPEATLYAAITREIAAKGTKARFKKQSRGLFVPGRAE
ncbi:MAG: hypothetical protein IT432_17395 [Phycisphaerales bacterium]|nr:hypothetical protein [Phycisphaerales bacterium]